MTPEGPPGGGVTGGPSPARLDNEGAVTGDFVSMGAVPFSLRRGQRDLPLPPPSPTAKLKPQRWEAW